MSALAELLKDRGKTVAGSDICANEYTDALEKKGIHVTYGETDESVGGFDAVVYTDAIKETNVQLLEAKKTDKIMISRGRLLGEICALYKTVIAVSGCHGKTTCCSMLAHIFRCSEKKFASHIGGRDTILGNYYSCGDEYLITEACEYKKNFLLLKPDISVLLNSDADHLECYDGKEELRRSYALFAEKAKTAVCLYGDVHSEYGITFGFDDRADYYAKCMKNNGGKFSFVAYEGDGILGKVQLEVYGKHNVLNALAAIAVSRALGLSFENIRDGLSSFKGVERRFEILGTIRGCPCIADYAHHPNEIRAVLKTAALTAKGELYVVFQPHTYSRTKSMFQDFVKTLSPLKNLLIYKTFAAREYFDDAGSALTLSQALKKARYADDPRDILLFLNNVKQGDKVLFLGAGDIYYIAKKIIEG